MTTIERLFLWIWDSGLWFPHSVGTKRYLWPWTSISSNTNILFLYLEYIFIWNYLFSAHFSCSDPHIIHSETERVSFDPTSERIQSIQSHRDEFLPVVGNTHLYLEPIVFTQIWQLFLEKTSWNCRNESGIDILLRVLIQPTTTFVFVIVRNARREVSS